MGSWVLITRQDTILWAEQTGREGQALSCPPGCPARFPGPSPPAPLPHWPLSPLHALYQFLDPARSVDLREAPSMPPGTCFQETLPSKGLAGVLDSWGFCTPHRNEETPPHTRFPDNSLCSSVRVSAAAIAGDTPPQQILPTQF